MDTATAKSPAISPGLLAEQAFSRAAGTPLIEGNAVELLIDAEAHFAAWRKAIAGARQRVVLENYMVRNDDVGRGIRDALVERAQAGIEVYVIRDWLGCLGVSHGSFWQPLIEAGGEVRVYNPPQFLSPFGWISRDHRKLLVIDGALGFLSGVCISAQWLGNSRRGIAPWRDTGVSICGPAVATMETAFAQIWSSLGPAMNLPEEPPTLPQAGEISLRVIATEPNVAGLYRLDQLIASMARETLWLTDAYFVGMAPYVQALAAAARDGVDVRLLVPGSSDVPVVAALSRSGYRPLLQAGVRVFEWNGSMLHAKTAVADGRWARVGSSNLNLMSWMGNCEIDVAIENRDFAAAMQSQYEADLENATEIVLGGRRRARPRSRGGSPGRAAAGAMRLANTVGAALGNRRVLGAAEIGVLLSGAAALVVLGVLGIVWPAVLAWPLALIALWMALSLLARARLLRERARREARDGPGNDAAAGGGPDGSTP